MPINSARTAFTAGTAGSKFQQGQVRRLERELKRGDGLSNKQWVQHLSVFDREIKSSPSRELCRLPTCYFVSERNSVGRIRA